MLSTRNTFLDFLRLTAVLLVITSHYAYMFDASTLITFPRKYLTGGIGRLGVSLFFMISGALAYVSLTRYSLREYYVRRACSVLIPYNMVYLTAALILLVLGLYFRYPVNPLEQLMNGEKSVIAFLPTLVGIDHYLHGIWGVETAYLTGEWFIGCIILHYAIAPLVFRIMQLAPLLTMSATLAVSIVCYDRTLVNPYWSAQVRISDFAFGMLFMHFLPWFCKWRCLLAVTGITVITCGCVMAYISQKGLREVLLPLAPRSLIFSVAFLFILHACYPVINRGFIRFRLNNNVSGLASRAYIIMLLQHVVIIFISANINMAELNASRATLFWVLALITTERISAALKTCVAKAENFTVKHILKKC
ncbi:acyltransferase [Enterobacter ludwigii]|uniref:acyltransferase family protein n=1 Tax=Enterobacter ludwigii TaxID=299767 RepID=UPI00159C32CC|nr:acyltransferase family protein [Enterobacter ludwigii]QLA06967.1 acyltransferase [Enterobacter ludwigii]